MKQYTVRSGENIYDIAIKLYGSIEGVLDLLIENENAIDGGPLTFDTELKAGMVLNYESTFIINGDVTNWVADNDVKVANGHHYYKPDSVKQTVLNFAKQYNDRLIKKAARKWPETTESADYLRYIYNNYVGSGISELEILAKKSVVRETYGEDVIFDLPSKDEDDLWLANMISAKFIIHQTGMLSGITAKINQGGMMLIDWGDLSDMDAMTFTEEESEVEHCYESSDDHTIIIYGNFQPTFLDFTSLNGIYYPLRQIIVNGEFKSNIKDSAVNELIIINNSGNE